MIKKSIQRTSLIRLIPALFVGLLPFTPFEDALLQAKYRLRGTLEPPPSVRVVVTHSRDRLLALLKAVPTWDAAQCHVITAEKLPPNPCHSVLIEGLYTPEEIRRAVYGEDRPDMPLFYGPLQAFRPIDVELALARGLSLFKETSDLIILDASFKPRIPIATPVGRLDQGSFAVNAEFNRIEGRSLEPLPRGAEWVVSIAMALLAALALYSYPTTLTMVVVTLLGAFEFAISFLLFEGPGLHLPVAGSWFAMLTAVLLGMGDRLDRRERREWAVEREAESLKSLDEMRNNFLSLVSHDLKTPIARILSLLDRFVRGEFGSVTPQQKETLERVVSTSGYLQRTISTLLLLSRIESRDFRIRRAPADLTEILEAAIRQHETPASERNIRLVKEFEPLFLVDMDRDLISEVVNNLIDNALKYSPAGSVLTVRSGELENAPELSPPQPGVWFEVQDEGAGIPPGDRERVTQKFIRGSNESTASDQSVKGTGLGLYLSKFFVEQHGGDVRIFSRVKGEPLAHQDVSADYFSPEQSGTVVRITLPIDPPLVDVG